MGRRRWALGLGIALAALLLSGAWLAFTARSAYADLTAARDDLMAARDAIGARDAEAAAAATTAAAERAASAASSTSGPLWAVAAAIPRLGDTPESVRAVATSLDQAVSALAPAVRDVVGLDADSLVGPDGAIAGLAAVEAALPALQGAQSGVESGVATLSAAPTRESGAWVPATVDDARAQLLGELESLASTLDTLVAVAEIAPPMLGADGPRRYFVAILNPNEARGTGGFLGSWVIMRAEEGRLEFQEVGSNEDLPRFDELPIDLGPEFDARYGQDANEIGNMNLSPHFPNAAQLWLASWEARTGEQLDGAISADVVALGDLVSAGGQTVPLPDGGSVSGAELTELAHTGIYVRFPTVDDVAARKEYQEQVSRATVEAVTDALAANPAAVATTLGQAVSERRVLAWARDAELEDRILGTPLGGSLAVEDGPDVAFVALDSSASKLDAYLERSVRYEVGRCPDEDGFVRSQFAVTLTNAVPDVDLPPYVVSQADRGPDGPVNSTLAQVHLPNGARLLSVSIDGEPAFHSPFTEQGRPSTVLDMDLPPRSPRTVVVDFLEPFVDRPAAAPAQPLATPAETSIAQSGC